MKDFFITIILTIVIILIIAGVGILGINIYKDFNIYEVGDTVQNFVSDITSIAEEPSSDNEISSIESPLTNIKSVDSLEDKNITYSNNSNTKNNHFYNQLNEYSKTIYNVPKTSSSIYLFFIFSSSVVSIFL